MSLLFFAEQNDNLEHIKSAINKNCMKLMDTLKLYELSSQKNDVLNISLNNIESCSCRQDKMNRLNNHIFYLDQQKTELTVEENPESIKLLLNSASAVTTKLSKDLMGLLLYCGLK